MTHNLLTVAQVAAALQCHPRSVRRMIACGALIAALVGLCSECAASEPVADRTCIWSDTTLTCYDLFVADVVLDSSPQPLTSEAGPGFMRLGYVDSVTGRWIEVVATGYAWRTWTSYPQPRTILVWVDEYDLIGGGGFEGEYAHPLR